MAVPMPEQTEPCDFSTETIPASPLNERIDKDIKSCMETGEGAAVFDYVRDNIASWRFDDVRTAVRAITEQAKAIKTQERQLMR